MTIGIDTNVLGYALSAGKTDADRLKSQQSIDLLLRLAAPGQTVPVVAPVQVLGELVIVLRRGGVTMDAVVEAIRSYRSQFIVVPSTEATLSAALDLAARHKLQFWDSLILAACQQAGCALFLSEDLQDGFRLGGMTVANPFTASGAAAVEAALAG